MNKFKLAAVFVGLLAIAAACKKDDPKPSVEEAQLQKLIGTWKMGSVTVDGTNVNDQYTNFVLTIYKDASGTKLVAANGGYAFPAVGADSWNFVSGASASKITRLSDNVELTVSVGESTLTLEFTITAPAAGGRLNGLEGHFVFVLTKA